jgi:hypothetical protein
LPWYVSGFGVWGVKTKNNAVKIAVRTATLMKMRERFMGHRSSAPDHNPG